MINVNVFDVIRILKADRKRLCLYSISVGIIGLIFAFATPKIYKSTVILAPEESGAGFSGSLSSLASLVGMNMKLGQTGDAIYPELYPDMMKSTDFIVGLFPVVVTNSKSGQTYSYYDYLQKHQKIAFYDYPKVMLLNLIRMIQSGGAARVEGEAINPTRLTRDEYDVYLAVKDMLKCTVDRKTDVITITVTDQDPVIAANVADSVQQHLQSAITAYRTKKACIDLEYMEKLFQEAKTEYDEARHNYAKSSDANFSVELQSVKMKIDDLEKEMQLKYNIYNTIVEQLQLAKAKVQERTPAFTTIQSASVPVKHSNLPKIVSLLLSMFLGFLIRVSMLAWKNKDMFISPKTI